MEFDQKLAELFADEDRARAMARRLMELAQSNPAATVAEKPSVLAFLCGPMEAHMAYEETALFPLLVERGLGPEVEVAQKHHAAIRAEVASLRAATDAPGIARAIFLAARMMLHHTNFEGDYIYPELNRSEWRDLMKQTVEKSG